MNKWIKLIKAEKDIKTVEELIEYMRLFSTSVSRGQLPQSLGKIKVKDINERSSEDGMTPLTAAILFHRFTLAYKFLDEGADVNKPDSDMDTPLHFAVMVNNLDLVKKLIDLGANLDVKNNEGETPLDIAEHEHKKKIVEFLRSVKNKK